jgi:U3 small nucleolar RNA-associated protein 10
MDALQPKRTVSDVLLGFNEKTPEQANQTIFNLLTSLARLLENPSMNGRVGKVLRHSTESTELHTTFAAAIERATQLARRLKGQKDLYKACSRVLSGILELLPTINLIETADTLLENSDDDIRRTALQAVGIKVGTIKQGDEPSIQAALGFLARIGTIIQHSQDTVLKQTAVNCIDQISERFGKRDNEAVAAAAGIVAGVQSLGSNDERLREGSILCLASVVGVIPQDFIPLLPTVLPKAFSYLELAINEGGKKTSLHNTIYSLLCSIIEGLPFMFTGKYLDRSLELSHKSAALELDEDCESSRELFYSYVAKHVEGKEFFDAINRTFADALQSGYEVSIRNSASFFLLICRRLFANILTCFF